MRLARMPEPKPEPKSIPAPMPSRPMRIGELAAVTGASPRALRHYEQAGLISSERAANGYRRYDAASVVVRVRNIRRLVAAGLTLDDVRLFLPCLDQDVTASRPTGRTLQVALRRLAVMEERIAAQIEVRDRLAAALAEATEATAAAKAIGGRIVRPVA